MDSGDSECCKLLNNKIFEHYDKRNENAFSEETVCSHLVVGITDYCIEYPNICDLGGIGRLSVIGGRLLRVSTSACARVYLS